MRWEWVLFCFFNGRLTSQIWHHKAKTHKSHPEGWCRLDCGRFVRIFFPLYFSITVLKKTRWKSARCKSLIFHIFFPLQAQSHMKNSEGEKQKKLSFFFLLSQRRWVEREWGWRFGKKKKKEQHGKLQKLKKKKNPNKIKTHRKWNTSSWTEEETEKKYM